MSFNVCQFCDKEKRIKTFFGIKNIWWNFERLWRACGACRGGISIKNRSISGGAREWRRVVLSRRSSIRSTTSNNDDVFIRTETTKERKNRRVDKKQKCYYPRFFIVELDGANRYFRCEIKKVQQKSGLFFPHDFTSHLTKKRFARSLLEKFY